MKRDEQFGKNSRQGTTNVAEKNAACNMQAYKLQCNKAVSCRRTRWLEYVFQGPNGYGSSWQIRADVSDNKAGIKDCKNRNACADFQRRRFCLATIVESDRGLAIDRDFYNNFSDRHRSTGGAPGFVCVLRGQNDVVAGAHKNTAGEGRFIIKLDVVVFVVGDFYGEPLGIYNADHLLPTDHILNVKVMDMCLKVQISSGEGGVVLHAGANAVVQLIPAIGQFRKIAAFQKCKSGLKLGCGNVVFIFVAENCGLH